MLDRNVQKTILLQILKDVYTDTSLGPILGFKGGTAANFFYDLGRFSVDLDFDLLNEDREAFVFEKIEKILREYGTIKEKYRKKHTLLFVISYDEKSQNIKVEINRRIFGSRYELKNYLGISVLIMDKEDMFAHKLVAVMERQKTANRDVYDIWHFLKNRWPINKEIVEKRTGMNFKDHLKECIEFIDSLSDRNILSGMGELLDENQKAWVKTNLRKETVFLLKVRLEQEK
ncbi:MAG: nucleotidyl transferase AbiEii/AbiGii toxin family protein [Candidatus Aminicenantes bacterium]|nr:nucleotidyl transferase AbiEii/AbiGii toxin family protein [Candidatus Aminicenantes bacterium]MDH5745172.1 nucleotidyl transferase AbiEii/AbiGii toxin family protein [Candidatus Aminicenantes bacterium]